MRLGNLEQHLVEKAIESALVPAVCGVASHGAVDCVARQAGQVCDVQCKAHGVWKTIACHRMKQGRRHAHGGDSGREGGQVRLDVAVYGNGKHAILFADGAENLPALRHCIGMNPGGDGGAVKRGAVGIIGIFDQGRGGGEGEDIDEAVAIMLVHRCVHDDGTFQAVRRSKFNFQADKLLKSQFQIVADFLAARFDYGVGGEGALIGQGNAGRGGGNHGRRQEAAVSREGGNKGFVQAIGCGGLVSDIEFAAYCREADLVFRPSVGNQGGDEGVAFPGEIRGEGRPGVVAAEAVAGIDDCEADFGALLPQGKRDEAGRKPAADKDEIIVRRCHGC